MAEKRQTAKFEVPAFSVSKRPESIRQKVYDDPFPGLFDHIMKMQADEVVTWEVPEEHAKVLRDRLNAWLRKHKLNKLFFIGFADGLLVLAPYEK